MKNSENLRKKKKIFLVCISISGFYWLVVYLLSYFRLVSYETKMILHIVCIYPFLIIFLLGCWVYVRALRQNAEQN